MKTVHAVGADTTTTMIRIDAQWVAEAAAGESIAVAFVDFASTRPT
jgi:hypothetical protein